MAERRQALPAGERARLSAAAVARLRALPVFASPATGTIAGFLALAAQGEIDPAAALGDARARGAVVVYPRVTSSRPPVLRFHRVDDPFALPTPLAPGPFGLVEPGSTCPELSLESIVCMIVPGLAFDLAGRRVGFGGGYYDETAARLRAADRGLLVGFGYDFQVVPRCPAGPRDLTLDWIVTDQRAVRCAEAA